MMPIAKIVFEIMTEAAYRGITEHLPKHGTGINVYIDNNCGDTISSSQRRSTRKGSISNHGGRRPSCTPSLMKVLETHDTVSNDEASALWEKMGCSGRSAPAGLIRLANRKILKRISAGVYKLYKKPVA